MNDFTVVFQNQKSAASVLLAVSMFLAGSALAADPAATTPMASTTSVSVKTVTTTVTSGDVVDEKRIQKMHDSLQITQQQETLWGAVAETMRASDDRMEELSTKRHDHAATMTAVEDLASYGEMMHTHAESIKAFNAAFVPLYEVMSTTQKANADQVFRGTGRKGHKKAL